MKHERMMMWGTLILGIATIFLGYHDQAVSLLVGSIIVGVIHNKRYE